MMRSFKKICFVLFAFFAFTLSVNAQSANADGGNGYSGNVGHGCLATGVACGMQRAHRIRVRLVYYDGKKENVLAGPTEVEPDKWGWYTVGNDYSFNSANFQRTVVGSNSDPKDQRRAKLQQFVNDIGWHIDLNTLTKDSCEVDRKGNCYGKAGYRVIAELYIGLSEYVGQGTGTNYVSVKQGSSPDTRDGYFMDYGGVNRGTDISNKMSIVWADIHYTCNRGGKGVCNNSQTNINCLVNDNCGYGIWIVDITSAVQVQHDYSIDMACENCNSKNPDHKAMVIQDSTNWEAIKLAKDGTSGDKECNSRVKKHFYKTDNVYCREEYHVHFPNENSKIKVHLGRFFTVNADDNVLKTLEDGKIPNFAPIQVVKSRSCRGSDADLNNFKRNSDADFSGCGGDVFLTYKENKKEGGYSLSNSKLASKLQNFTSTVSGGNLEQKAVFNYTLKNNIFRYIRIKDGYSVNGNYSSNTDYRDVGISNIPVSMGIDISGDKKVGSLNLRYSLPGESDACSDKYSDMHNAVTADNRYLDCVKDRRSDNIYKKYKNNKKDDHESIDDSACVKLYHSKTSKEAVNCINDRVDNKMGKCYNSYKNNNYICDVGANVCSKETAGKDPYKDMFWDDETKSCIKKCSHSNGKYYDNSGKQVDKGTYENVCCNSSNYKEMGRGWDKKKNVCCPSGTFWSDKSEMCCLTSEYTPSDMSCKPPVCNADNYESMGRDWNDNEGKCCPEGYKYDSNNKKCEVPAPDKCKIGNLSCDDKPCCTDCHGKSYCGNGSVSKGTGYCPGKPCVTTTSSGGCETEGCDLIKDVVTYRTFDPVRPFETQGGGARETGDNWCSNPAGGNHVCSGTVSNNKSGNTVVQKVILDKAKVSENDAMYTIKFESARANKESTIDKIRRYNNDKEHDYDDFNMTCHQEKGSNKDKNSVKCRSNFLNNYIRSDVDTTRSKCFGVGYSSFDTCG